MQQLPGVEAAGFSSLMPFVGYGINTALQVEGRPQKPWSEVGTLYRRACRLARATSKPCEYRSLAGRYLTIVDKDGDVIAMVINQALAKKNGLTRIQWDPLSRLLPGHDKRFQVVGVVGDVRNFGLEERRIQSSIQLSSVCRAENMHWAIRSNLDEATLTRECDKRWQALIRNKRFTRFKQCAKPLRIHFRRSDCNRCCWDSLRVAALVLSVIGVYGVVSYTVRQRTTEMGTRMALGADSRSVLKLVMGDGLRMSVIGTAAGVMALLALAKILGAARNSMCRLPMRGRLCLPALVIGSLTLLRRGFRLGARRDCHR